MEALLRKQDRWPFEEDESTLLEHQSKINDTDSSLVVPYLLDQAVVQKLTVKDLIGLCEHSGVDVSDRSV